MNIVIFLPVIIAIVIALSGCGATQGSILILEKPDGTGCSMQFKEWSDENKCELQLSKGDELFVEISHESGDSALTVCGKNGSEAYAGNALESCAFTVAISEADTYLIQISGNNATGSLSINKITDSQHGNESVEEAEAVMEGIDVPEAVSIAAKARAAKYFDMNCTDFPEYQYTAWRIENLEWVYTYDDMAGITLDIYRMNYELHSKAPENVIITGGMYIAEGNWVCPTYPSCTYLVFNADSDACLFDMVENDCTPGDETFTEDVYRMLSLSQV